MCDDHYQLTTIQSNLGVDFRVMVHQAPHHILQTPLTPHVQWRGEQLLNWRAWLALSAITGAVTRSGGTVDVGTVLDEEASCFGVPEENGSVQESQCGSILTHVPGIGITPMHNLHKRSIHVTHTYM